MLKAERLVAAILAAVLTIISGVLVAPLAQANAVPQAGYVKAEKLKHYESSNCPNNHYMHVAEWSYCLNGKVYGEGDSGYWYWDDDTKTLTFDNFVLKRSDFTQSYGGGTFIEPVFDRSTVGMNELTVKFRGTNEIYHQSNGHVDALTLMFTMKSGGVQSKQTNPTVKLIGESADSSLTIDSDITNSKPGYSQPLSSWGAPLTIGGAGTINLHPGYSGVKPFKGAMGIDASTVTITDDVTVNIAPKFMNRNSTSITYGVVGIDAETVLKGNSKVNIDMQGLSGGMTLGIFSRKDVSVTENTQLNINVQSPINSSAGIYAYENVSFSTFKDAKISAPGGRVILASKTATFNGPGDVIGSGSADASLQGVEGINFAAGYGVYSPVAGSANNPAVTNKAGEKVGDWRLSMLPPAYDEVQTKPAQAVNSPVKTRTYQDAAQATTATYSAPATVEVKGKIWKVEINSNTGELTVTPHKDALKGDRAEIPVTLTYINEAFAADAAATTDNGSNKEKSKVRTAIAPVVISEATATPQAPSAEDFEKVAEGSWQKEVIPTYEPAEDGEANPLNGMFTYTTQYLNNDGAPFNPKDPVSKGKKAVVVVSLTDKGKENYTALQCPAAGNVECVVQDDGTIKFVVPLKYKERPAQPGNPDQPGGTQPGTDSGNPGQPGGNQSGTTATDKEKPGMASSAKSLSKTGAMGIAALGFGAGTLLLLGCALRRRNN